MSCCSPGVEGALEPTEKHAGRASSDEEVLLASRRVGDALRQTDLSVPGIHCGGCIRTVETALSALPGVDYARVNLSTKRVAVRWRGRTPPPLLRTLKDLGFETHLFETETDDKDPALAELLRALAVAGFAAMNIMLLSVSVWSGRMRQRATSSTGSPPRSRCPRSLIAAASSSARPGRPSATAAPTWTCRSRSA